MNCTTRLISAVTLYCFAISAQAISVYTSETSFLNQLILDDFVFNTIDFEGQSAGQEFSSGDSIGGASFNFSMAQPLVIDNSLPTTSGDNLLGANDDLYAFFGGDSFDVSTGDTLRAAGLYVIGEPSANFADDFTLTTSNGDSVSNLATPDQLLFHDNGDAAGDAFFIGLIADDPSEFFTSFNLSSFTDNFAFTIDDITYGTTALNPVPLPATAWLFAGALLGWFGFERRQRNSKKI